MDIAITNPTEKMDEAVMSLTGKTLSGVRLLGQRVLIALLTNISGVLRRNEGSTLSNTLGSIQVVESLVRMAIGTAVSSIQTDLHEDDEMYSDEDILGDIYIDDVTVESTGRIIFTISVTNRAGESETVSGEDQYGI